MLLSILNLSASHSPKMLSRAKPKDTHTLLAVDRRASASFARFHLKLLGARSDDFNGLRSSAPYDVANKVIYVHIWRGKGILLRIGKKLEGERSIEQ